ncbi:MAG: CAP domain-containing protein [Phototrophicaceae bacterium]
MSYNDWGTFSSPTPPPTSPKAPTVGFVVVLLVASLMSFAFGFGAGWFVFGRGGGFDDLPIASSSATTPTLKTTPVPTVRTLPGVSIDPTTLGEEEQIVTLVNDARAAQGLNPLRINPILTRAALLHSQDQATQQLLSHDGSDGSQVADRVSRAGYSWRIIGENVLLQHAQDAGDAFLGWWSSPPHQKNMMNPDFEEIGIAFSTDTNGAYYYTMVLGTS